MIRLNLQQFASGSTGRGKGGKKGGKTAASSRFSGPKYTYNKKKVGKNTKLDTSTPW